jgi:hypothetical protein
MKIYNEVVIDMNTNEVVSEDSFEYDGELMLCGGGGGAGAGEIAYPGYIEDFHEAVLGIATAGTTQSITDAAEAIKAVQDGTSPYASVTAYEPDGGIDSVYSRYIEYDAYVSAYNETTHFQDLVDVAYDKYDSKVMSQTAINDAVEQYDKRTQRTYAQALNRFAGPMADIGAVNSSAFIIGTALMEADRQRDTNEYNANQSLAFHNLKVQAVTNASSQLGSMLLQKIELHKASATMLQEFERMKHVMKGEQEARNTELSRADALWDLEALVKGASIISYPSGAGYIPDKPSKTSSALGGALSGAATGAAIGSVVPGLGTAVGAGIGAVVGAIGGAV